MCVDIPRPLSYPKLARAPHDACERTRACALVLELVPVQSPEERHNRQPPPALRRADGEQRLELQLVEAKAVEEMLRLSAECASRTACVPVREAAQTRLR
ncbi:hypothetical protein DENSPDRAFT_878884 [Dentipellis sp. KUC8613]|nr:hypothetical protein DENSPDRAFT_878884 [Dentipellis sp. KUC8613]